jgi:GTPase SAR1 family protein
MPDHRIFSLGIVPFNQLFQCRENAVFNSMRSARRCCVVLCGDSRSGKTSLFRAIQAAPFTDDYEPTVLADHFRLIDPNPALPDVPELNFWDTGGDAQNRSAVKVYLRGADAILIVTESVSIPQLKAWSDIAVASNGGQRAPTIAIVKSRKDLQFSPQEENALRSFTEQRHWEGFVVSAKTGEGIQEMIRKLCDICRERKLHPPAMLPEQSEKDPNDVACHCEVA